MSFLTRGITQLKKKTLYKMPNKNDFKYFKNIFNSDFERNKNI